MDNYYSNYIIMYKTNELRNILQDIKKDIKLHEWQEFIIDQSLDNEPKSEQKEQIRSFIHSIKFALFESDSRDVIIFGNYCIYISSNTDEAYTLYLMEELLPERIKKLLGIVEDIDPYTLFIDENKSNLPDKLKKDLQDWDVSRKI